jgi:hypothetical protein
MRQEVDRMRERGPTTGRAGEGQRYLAGLFPLRTETNESLAAVLADMALYGLGDDWLDRYRDRVHAVTRAEAQEAAAAYCFPEPPLTVVVGSAERLRPQLERFGRWRSSPPTTCCDPHPLDRAGLVAVDKPAGMPVVPDGARQAGRRSGSGSRRSWAPRLWVVHRLDRDTSGVLLLALDATTHRAASLAFEHGTPEKRYLALVSPPLGGPVRVDAALVPARRSGCGSASRARRASRRDRARAAGDLREVALVEARPLTGRTHQIRVHLRHAGAPLLVDPQYGRPEPVSERRLGGSSDARCSRGRRSTPHGSSPRQ